MFSLLQHFGAVGGIKLPPPQHRPMRKGGGGGKRCRFAAEEMRENNEWCFQAYGRPLTLVTSCKFLVWILVVLDDEWPVVVVNFWKAQVN